MYYIFLLCYGGWNRSYIREAIPRNVDHYYYPIHKRSSYQQSSLPYGVDQYHMESMNSSYRRLPHNISIPSQLLQFYPPNRA
jgi:hypothetical protein